MRKAIRIGVVFLFFSLHCHGQWKRVDALGNFQAVDGKLSWQKTYALEDKAALQEKIAAEPFTSGLNVLEFGTSALTEPFRLQAAGLPEYARHDFRAFLSIDFFPGTFRVTVKQIVFPDFVEKVYYNGMRQTESRGSLEHYVLKQDGSIMSTSAANRVLASFDQVFSEIFDPMEQ